MFARVTRGQLKSSVVCSSSQGLAEVCWGLLAFSWVNRGPLRSTRVCMGLLRSAVFC